MFIRINEEVYLMISEYLIKTRYKVPLFRNWRFKVKRETTQYPRHKVRIWRIPYAIKGYVWSGDKAWFWMVERKPRGCLFFKNVWGK